MIRGSFKTYNGAKRYHIARLNSDGTLDHSFNTATGIDDYISVITIQNNGKILVAGWFRNSVGLSDCKVIRFNNDGSLDTTFQFASKPNNNIYDIALQDDGKILICGAFDQQKNGLFRNIARLNSDGSFDESFPVITGLGSQLLSVQSDGKILTYGEAYAQGKYINSMIRLHKDGSEDFSFTPAIIDNSVDAIAIQNDGKIIIAGSLKKCNGYAIKGIVRLKPNGNFDNSFEGGVDADVAVRAKVIQSDGKIIIGGNFKSYMGIKINHLARLNNNETLDLSFNTSKGASDINYDVYNVVPAIAIQSDGKIVIGGSFTSYDGVGRNRIARVLSSPNETSVDLPISTNNFSIFPNPARNIVSISTSFTDGKIEVYTTAGTQVYTANLSSKSTELDFSKLEQGIYLIKLHHAGGVTVSKVVIE